MPKNDALLIDLNLLAIFHLLMQERSVTAVARRLRLGQPAVSRSLARLRQDLGDPLFVRVSNKLEPTPRATALHTEITPALDLIEQALRRTAAFDPTLEDRVFHIGMSDDIQLSFLPAISNRMLAAMPKSRLVVRQTDYLRAGPMLADRSVSIVVGYLEKLPAEAKIRRIVRVGYRTTMCKSARPPKSLKAYSSRPHVLVTFAGDLTGYVDEVLTEKAAERSVLLSVSAFSVLPFVLKGTDRIATVPEHAANALTQHNALRSARLPFASPMFDLSIAWRATTDRDAAEQLVRDIIIDEMTKFARTVR